MILLKFMPLCSRFSGQLLSCEQVGIESAARHQIFVAALLDDAALVQDDDVVGLAQGGDAVGDEDGGAVFHDLAEVAQNRLFGLGVHG